MLGNEVIGYSNDKKIVKEFIGQYAHLKELDFVVLKITDIPEDYEYQFNFKEFYKEGLNNNIVNEYLKGIVEVYLRGILTNLEGSNKWFRDFMDYVKLEPHERDNVFHLYYFMTAFIEDITPQDDDVMGFSYNDYIVYDKVITMYLQGNIKITEVS